MKMTLYDMVKLSDLCQSLQILERFNNVKRIKSENVAAHMYSVIFIARMISSKLIEGVVDQQKISDMAMIHDIPEIVLSDIPHSVKRDIPEINTILQDKEIKIISDLLKNEYFTNLLIEYNEQKTLESKIVKLADTLSVLSYVTNEVSLGNKDLEHLKDDVFNRVVKIQGEIDALC